MQHHVDRRIAALCGDLGDLIDRQHRVQQHRRFFGGLPERRHQHVAGCASSQLPVNVANTSLRAWA